MADNVTKVFDLIKEMTVLELNDLRKKIEEEFDVKAVAPVAVAGAAGADSGADSGNTTVSVFVKDPGASKIEVIKVIREITGLALKEAKEMAESAGAKPLKEGIEQTEADQIAEKLKAAGAVVEIK
ncbi:LSU ribosomal protein L12P [Brevinema andersonii]|uniref:Large ribosomal subunit protein bL12 n=1 Tax=Brevinema andersonii TaxID=34097 RepID=A0A1I1D794_BREAD|nr:50S ribosomal protein L7/L12 [Brevinema andersonii]SFB68433.1 LSU ribosomal protein L12P [Brevinema andersonii]